MSGISSVWFHVKHASTLNYANANWEGPHFLQYVKLFCQEYTSTLKSPRRQSHQDYLMVRKLYDVGFDMHDLVSSAAFLCISIPLKPNLGVHLLRSKGSFVMGTREGNGGLRSTLRFMPASTRMSSRPSASLATATATGHIN